MGQAIEEEGIAIGEIREKVGIILVMHNNVFAAEQVSSTNNKDIEEIHKILKN